MTVKRTLMMLAVAVLIAALTLSCNTLRGVGKDVERGGEKIQDVAT
jgi:entericidin B